MESESRMIGSRQPFISVVMGVYNGEKYVQRAVDSILKQTYTDFEFVIVNDGSTDGTKAILESFDDPRLVLIDQENTGLTKALNRAIGQARGELIARQDADDFSLPERFAVQVAFLNANQDIALVGTAVNVIEGAGHPIATFRHPCEAEVISKQLRKHNCFCHGSVMFRRACFVQIGGYREIFLAAQDYDLWLRLAENFRMANLPEPLYTYRFTTSSITVSKMVDQHRLAALARRLAEMRKDGIAEGEELKEATRYLASPLTQSERREIVDNYKPWCRLLLENDLIEEGASLMAAVLRHHPRLSLRMKFQLVRFLKSPSLLTRCLDDA